MSLLTSIFLSQSSFGLTRLRLTSPFLVILLAGVLAIFVSQRYSNTKYSFASAIPSSVARAESHLPLPTFLTIPAADIGLPIEESNSWETKERTLSHIATSAVPGENDNIVLFVNKDEDLGLTLLSLNKGDILQIVTKDGKIHRYLVNDIVIANPTDSNLIASTRQETLTLYTTYGFGDLQRFVIHAVSPTDF